MVVSVELLPLIIQWLLVLQSEIINTNVYYKHFTWKLPDLGKK